MPEDVKSFLGLAPSAGQASAATPAPAVTGRVRWSLITFFVGSASMIVGFFLVMSHARWIGDWSGLFFFLVPIGELCLLISIVCGCLALLKRRLIVLWWMFPAILTAAFIGYHMLTFRIQF